YTFYGETNLNSAREDTKPLVGGASTATGSLVTAGSGFLNITAANTYSGGTIIDQGVVNLMGSAGTVVIPGNLTINGGTTQAYPIVDMIGNSGQIASSSVVTINGPGLLFLTGDNTLNSLVFNNNGGSAV